MTTPTWLRHDHGRRLEFGADYNPEQWTPDVWHEDVRLMREAGVTIVSLGIFSWAHLQPGPDRWEFGWLDEVMDLLHEHGIAVDLATATASPPPWLTTAHPEILLVDREGRTRWPGGRQHYRVTSPVFRQHALALVDRIARRYADHPALVAWHVSNELGCDNVHDYSDDAARAFRAWLQRRYRDIDALNDAWGTAFWSQRYGAWEEIQPPRIHTSFPNPTQELDFKRFSSDALLDHFVAEREVLRAITPDVPVTTNFMVMNETNGMRYPQWAPELDFVSNDHYVLPGPQSRDELSFSANLTGHLSARPWFLMEHSTSAVNWQPVNRAKRPGELARDSLTHVAHGADAVCFFQWRQSRAGAEKYHSAMLPHAGEDSRLFRDVVELGARLRALREVQGSVPQRAPIAILFDWESWWAVEQTSRPSDRLRYRQEALDWYSACLDAGLRADVIPADADLGGYRLVIAPILHVVDAARAARLTAFVEAGGHLVTTYASGIVDEHDHIWTGGHPGALRDLLGIRVEEFAPLLADESVSLDSGAVGTIWSERVDVVDAEVLARYVDGEHADAAAVTRRVVGEGSAAYVSTRLGRAGLATVLPPLADAVGIASELPESLRGRVELAVRGDGTRAFWFLINRTDDDVALAVEGATLDGVESLAPRGVVVLERVATDTGGVEGAEVPEHAVVL